MSVKSASLIGATYGYDMTRWMLGWMYMACVFDGIEIDLVIVQYLWILVLGLLCVLICG